MGLPYSSKTLPFTAVEARGWVAGAKAEAEASVSARTIARSILLDQEKRKTKTCQRRQFSCSEELRALRLSVSTQKKIQLKRTGHTKEDSPQLNKKKKNIK